MQSEENRFLSSVCGIFWQGKRAGVLDSYFGKKKNADYTAHFLC